MADAEQAKWLNQSEASAWRSLIEVSFGLFDQLSAELKAEHELTIQDYEVLHLLSEADGLSLRVGELADKMIASRTRLTQRLDRLADRDLVVKTKCPSDARAVNVELTKSGLTLLTEIAPAHVQRVRELVFDHLSATQITQLEDSLGVLADEVRHARK